MYDDNDDSKYKTYCYECDSSHEGYKCPPKDDK